MKFYWRRIKISDCASEEATEAAKEAASNHQAGELEQLDFTESNFEWVLLYNHARLGQINPKTMRYMKKRDLYFLAGMTYPHPDLAEPEKKGEMHFMAKSRKEQLTKLQANVERARVELRRREFFWRSVFIVGAAFFGAIISGAIALYIKML